MQVLYRSLLTLILSHAHGDALPARVGANLEAEILKVRTRSANVPSGICFPCFTCMQSSTSYRTA